MPEVKMPEVGKGRSAPSRRPPFCPNVLAQHYFAFSDFSRYYGRPFPGRVPGLFV
jgi:hypothetical protein